MFDIGWGKIVIIAVIALIVIGPKELPAVLRTVGQWMGKIRRMAAEFQGQFQEAMREAEMADLKKSVDAITEATRDIGSGFDPLGSVSKHIEPAFDDKATPPASPPPVATGEPAAAGEAPAAAAPVVDQPVPIESPVPIEPPVPVAPPGAPHPVADVAGHDVGSAAPAPPAGDAGGRAA
jgi:sec-independent protein translocase protein TatB